jgi:hypothetical protein
VVRMLRRSPRCNRRSNRRFLIHAGPVRDCYECMVRRATAREKFGREDKSAQMYSAFGWRVVLLARMSCARACPSKLVGRSGPFVTAGCGHAVVTVLSSLLPLCRLRWESLSRRGGAGKWERVALPSRRRLFRTVTPLRVCTRCRWTAQPTRYEPACWPWRPRRRFWALLRRAHRATLQSVLGRA